VSNTTNIQWVLTALRTITPNHQSLQEVSLHAPCLLCGSRRAIGEAARRRWSEFDHLLARLWESHSICLKVRFFNHADETNRRCANSLLPESSKRGMVALADPES